MNYEDVGFDGFLSRSVDDLSQVNLESQGPQSKQIRYDSAQVSGMLGDVLQIGKIRLDGSKGSIIANDGQNDFLFIGEE